jgi:hypothetical protein
MTKRRRHVLSLLSVVMASELVLDCCFRNLEAVRMPELMECIKFIADHVKDVRNLQLITKRQHGQNKRFGEDNKDTINVMIDVLEDIAATDERSLRALDKDQRETVKEAAHLSSCIIDAYAKVFKSRQVLSTALEEEVSQVVIRLYEDKYPVPKLLKLLLAVLDLLSWVQALF